jgi:peptidoglycan glycosyltransferase
MRPTMHEVREEAEAPWSEESPTPVPMVHEGAPSVAGRPLVERLLRLRAQMRRLGERSRLTEGAVMERLSGRPALAGGIAAAFVASACLVPVAMRSKTPAPAPSSSSSTSAFVESLLERPETSAAPVAASKATPAIAALGGLDLKSIAIDDEGAVASVGAGRVARLTLDSKLQSAAVALLNKHKLPQASIVAMDPATGRVLAYASKGGDGRDLAIEATAPSASVFKIVTGAALVQVAGVPIDTKLCYSGGEQKITANDLKDDPKHDAYCATLAQAMGRSINTIFAKLASRKLNGADLSAIAGQLGYGQPLPFDVPVQTSSIELPTETLAFARTAAGFWNTTLSPLHGAVLASTIANGGVMMRPFIVDSILDGTKVVYKAPAPTPLRKAIEPASATAVGTMMLETVSQGTSFKAFHDKTGKAFLPGIEVAGKTGTLNNPNPVKLYTWFVGYAPAKAPKIAVSVLVANDPVWKVKANTVARELLQAYFHAQGAANVQPPSLD